MTVHQLHYTSCEDGLEGIQGFQISAMTPGAPKPLVDLAVRASAYEIGPDQLARLDNADPGSFPVAFGYVPSGDSATLFQSRYVGIDFTGRTGNYFAHALLLDNAEAELHDVLPIDMWRSPTWVHTRQNGNFLPAAGTLAPGSATAQERVERFLCEPGGYDRLTNMIGSAQGVLGGGGERLVLVVPDDQKAALWLSALCRSLPRRLCLNLSFVTYTARPEDATVLVSCTTPDVRLPTYGAFTSVDMTHSEPADQAPTRYAEIMARLWENNGAQAAIRLAEQATPALTAAELDGFAVILECTTRCSGATLAAEPLLLEAADLAVRRLPGTLDSAGWQRIAELLNHVGGLTQVPRWAEVLRAAVHDREPVTPALLGAFYVAALTAATPSWMPVLAEENLDGVAEQAVLPALTEDRADAIVDKLHDQRELVNAVLRVLNRRLADLEELIELAITLTPKAARLFRQAHAEGRTRLLIDLVLARNGQADRVATLAEAMRDESLEWWRLGEVLWPEPPSADDAANAVRTLHVTALTGTGLLPRITERLIRQADRDDVSPKDLRVIDKLLEPPIVGELSAQDAAVLSAVRMIDHFRRATPGHDTLESVRQCLTMLDSLPGAIADRMLGGIAELTLRAEPKPHHELLTLALGSGRGRFLSRYRRLAERQLAKAQPKQVAAVIVIWSGVPDTRARKQLLHESLPAAIARRRAKDLDAIGDQLTATAKKLPIDTSAPRGNWRTWWKTWRSEHERRGLLGFLGLRKGSR